MTGSGQPSRDRTPEEGPRHQHPAPLLAVLDNVRSAFNVGSIFRTSEAARIEGLLLCGITPYPPNEKLERTALGTSHRVAWSHHVDTAAQVRRLRSAGRSVWGVELVPGARDLFRTHAPQPLALVFGHETAGVDPMVLAACDGVVEIPMRGRKNSLNIATAFGIAIFEVLRQWEQAGDEAVRP
jgi:tRNA G18 (ribose-2'-O)-methylase SpoU